MKDSDIKAVAEALVKNSIRASLVDNVCYCLLCNGEARSSTDINHDLDYPCGIAEKLLEGMK